MKKIVTLLLVAALMSPAALAETVGEAAGSDVAVEAISAEPEVISAKPEVKDSMYARVTAGAAKITEKEDGSLYVEALDSNDEEVHFVISEDTMIVNGKGEAAELEEGAQFTAFTAWNKPTLMILPPRYNADVIVIDSENGEVLVDADAYKADGERYVNAANTLSISVEETQIVDRDGEAYEGELDGMDLLVFYDISTRSIPAQTNPIKVMVLGESGLLPEEIIPDEAVTKIAVGDAEFDIVDINGVEMTAVRPVAEALGLDVAWDNDLQRVSVGTVQMGVNFLIGVNSYNKAKMTPFTLEAAPYLEVTEAGGVTYLPVSFFTEVLGCGSETIDGVMTLTF